MLKLKVVRSCSVARPGSDLASGRIQIWRDSDGAVCAFGGSRDGEHWMHLPNLAVFQFGDGGHEVLALADPAALLESIVDAYHRSVLPMALQALDTQVLHASAVGTCRGVVALCAVSGTGKSTLAFGLSRRGYPVWGDDAVAFKASPSLAEAIPLPFATRLRPAAASLFGVDPGSTPFRTLDDWSEAEQRPTPLAALCVMERLPNVATGVTVERLSPYRAFAAVLAHAYCFSLDGTTRKRRMVEEYLRLTAIVPAFAVRFAPGLESIDAVLDDIESVVLDGVDSTITTAAVRNTEAVCPP